MTEKNIYQRLHEVMKAVSYVQKGDKQVNNQYRFVSHDQVTGKIRPALIDNGVMSIPQNMRHSKDGNLTLIEMDVRFVNIDKPDDFIDVPTVGYGIDPQDKGVGKAISYAVKYALLKALSLETGDDPERDSIDHKPEDKFSPENKSIQSMLFTRLGQCKDQGDILSFIDEYQKQIDALPKEMSEIINEQIEIRSDCIKRGVPLKETEVHGFAGVNDAIAWAGKMFPLIETFKSLKTLDQWEEHNRPFINGLECLNAKKYKKDDNGNQSDTGKSPRERFLQALMEKRVQLESVNTLNAPIG